MSVDTSTLQYMPNSLGAYGAASSTDNAIARFDGTTGKTIQNSGATVDDAGGLTALGVTTTLNFILPATTSSAGQIVLGGTRYLHAYQGSGSQNFFAGEGAGNFTLTSAVSNTGVGYLALEDLTTGDENSVFGASAGRNITTGLRNSLFGYASGLNITTTSDNTHIGRGAGWGLAGTGSGNVSIGFGALTPFSTSLGSNNVAIGTQALQSIAGGGTNMALGHSAGLSVTSGNGNSLLGYQAGYAGTAITTGSNNMLLGSQAQVNSSAATNRIVIGDTASGDTDNQVFLGNSSITAWVPGADNTVDLGRSARQIKTGYFGTSVITPLLDLPRTGAAATAGNATLVEGTVTVSTTAVTTNDVVMLTRKTSGGTLGTAITYTINSGVSFTITSDSALDTSTFSWLVVKTH